MINSISSVMLVLPKWTGIKPCAKTRAACVDRYATRRAAPRHGRAIVRKRKVAVDYNETYSIIVRSSTSTRELTTRFYDLKDISYRAIENSK
jgi:hypothetical protein